VPKAPRVRCRLCGKFYVDLLKHISITHDIGTIDEYRVKVREIEREEEKRGRFADFVESLKVKVKKGELTWEDYRSLVKNWQHQEDQGASKT
jgi:hypothetical protein